MSHVPAHLLRRIDAIERRRKPAPEPMSDSVIIAALRGGDHDGRHIDALHRRLAPHLEQQLLVGSVLVLNWDLVGEDMSCEFSGCTPVRTALAIVCEPSDAQPRDELIDYLQYLEEDPQPDRPPIAVDGDRARAGLMRRCLGVDAGQRIRNQAEEILEARAWPPGLLEAPSDEAIHRLCDPLKDLGDTPLLLGRSRTSSPEEREQAIAQAKTGFWPDKAGLRWTL